MSSVDPYRVMGPACISFSGGLTSGYMLARILDAHGGALPADVPVIFANTGRERPETLDFVHECGERWGVAIVWLEYAGRVDDPATEALRTRGEVIAPKSKATAVVGYETASRNGEPFAALIGDRSYLPNPVTRFCTEELKLNRMRDWMDSHVGREWSNVVGLRADEPHRVARIRARASRWEVLVPLYRAGVSVADVRAFWNTQPFRLQLESHEGNCDLCFMKGTGKTLRILEDRPDLAAWWIEQESRPLTGAKSGRFRKDRPPYAVLARDARAQMRLPFYDDDALPCACTD